MKDMAEQAHKKTQPLKESQPTVVIMHGWALGPGNAKKWQVFCSLLHAAGIRTQVLSVPGLDEPLIKAWEVDDYVGWLELQLRSQRRPQRHPQRRGQLHDSDEFGPLVLLGHSFGGQVGARCAAQHPGLLDGLVLVAPAGVRPRSVRAVVKRRLLGFFAWVAKPVLAVLPDRLRQLVRSGVGRVFGGSDYARAAGRSSVLQRTLQKVITQEIITDLPNIQTPTLVVWGDRDTDTPFAHSSIFAQKIPNAQLAVVANQRHAPQFSAPEEVAQAVVRFVEQIYSAKMSGGTTSANSHTT